MTVKIGTLARITVLAAFGVGACGAAAAQTTFYEQPALSSTSTPFDAWTSSYDDSNTDHSADFTTFDNFTLTTAASITSVTWQGFSFDYNAGTGDNPTPTTTAPDSFYVAFVADQGGVPAGEPLYEENVSYTSTAVGSTNYFDDGSDTIYSYSAQLPTGFAAAANTPYWFTVIAAIPRPASWTWTPGTGGDGASYQDDADGNGYVRTQDRTFSLDATPEPTPFAALSLGALGLAALGLKARKREAGAA